MNSYYTGVGSRRAPEPVMAVFTTIARDLSSIGYGLRSGHADGSDMAFELGSTVPEIDQIYLPWKGFNGSNSTLYLSSMEDKIVDEARIIASKIHPSWKTLPESWKALHTRNIFQVLGPNLESPSEFLICWTENGLLKGGTRTAIKVAQAANVDILNLGIYKEDNTNLLEIVRNFIFLSTGQHINGD